MFQRLRLSTVPLPQGNALIIGGLFFLNMVFNILGNASFKLSALAANWKGLVGWQVAQLGRLQEPGRHHDAATPCCAGADPHLTVARVELDRWRAEALLAK